jgi:hypothetical protein
MERWCADGCEEEAIVDVEKNETDVRAAGRRDVRLYKRANMGGES